MSTTNNTKLYIGDLPTSVDEQLLTEFIRECEPPTSLTLNRDNHGRPQNYAIVEFKTHQEAAHVIQELNYSKFDNIPIRISWFERNREKKANIFIKNLDESIDVAQLHEALSNYGEILSCKIALDRNGKSNGYGYIQFVRRENAETAIKELDGAYIENKQISVKPFIPHMHKNTEQTFTNVYIKNLPKSFKTDDDVKKLFEEYGEVQSAKLAVDPVNREPKGFGFCNMATHEQAVAAIEGLNGKQLEGADNALVSNRQMSKRDRQLELAKRTHRFRTEMYQKTKDRNFYMRNFGDTVTEAELAEIFSKFGEIESIKIVEAENNFYRSAYLLFKEKASADALIKQSLSIKVGDNTPYIAYFKPAERRRIEKARYNMTATTPNNASAMMNDPKSANVKNNNNAKEKLKVAITEEVIDRGMDDEEKRQITESLKKISEDQAAELNKDRQAFIDWFNARHEEYENNPNNYTYKTN
jgi:polyadenylate-binding protein